MIAYCNILMFIGVLHNSPQQRGSHMGARLGKSFEFLAFAVGTGIVAGIVDAILLLVGASLWDAGYVIVAAAFIVFGVLGVLFTLWTAGFSLVMAGVALFVEPEKMGSPWSQ
jgi:hypothetical protein